MSEKCKQLHQWFNNLEKMNFPFDDRKIPHNGIYILFEKGESAHKTDKIVRIRTHTGKNQLRSRLTRRSSDLSEHFQEEYRESFTKQG